MFDINQSIENQKRFNIVPSDGICPKCKKNIYEESSRTNLLKHDIKTGITVQRSKSLITRCCHCDHSFIAQKQKLNLKGEHIS